MINPFVLNQFYNFNTLAPGILPASYTNVKVLAIVGYDVANMYANVNAIAASVAPVLPTINNKDPSLYNYVIFETSNSNKTILALDWIDLVSVSSTTSVTTDFTVSNITLDDNNIIRQALIQMGYNNISVTNKPNTVPVIASLITDVTLINISLSVNVLANVIAIGVYNDKSVNNITNQVIWTSDMPTVATINPSTGLITGVAVGTAIVKCTIGGISSPNVKVNVLV